MHLQGLLNLKGKGLGLKRGELTTGQEEGCFSQELLAAEKTALRYTPPEAALPDGETICPGKMVNPTKQK